MINKRLEIKQAGIEVPHDHAKSLMMEGLREEFRTAISFLRVSKFESNDTLQSKLGQICNNIGKWQKSFATADSASAHFVSINDAFGYQQPPTSVRPRNPARAETCVLQNVIDGFRAHLSVNNSIGDEAIRAVEHALMAATTDNMVCYFFAQHGHIAANCPRKRHQRPQHNPSDRFPNHYEP